MAAEPKGYGFCAMFQLVLCMAFYITAMNPNFNRDQLVRNSKSMDSTSDEYMDRHSNHLTCGECSGIAELAMYNLSMRSQRIRCEMMKRSAVICPCNFNEPNHVQMPKQHFNCLADGDYEWSMLQPMNGFD